MELTRSVIQIHITRSSTAVPKDNTSAAPYLILRKLTLMINQRRANQSMECVGHVLKMVGEEVSMNMYKDNGEQVDDSELQYLCC